MAPRLVADETLVIVPAGQSAGSTKISFFPENARSFQLLFRYSVLTGTTGSFSGWLPVPPNAITRNADGSGFFHIAQIVAAPGGQRGMEPGQVLNFVLLRENLPNQPFIPEKDYERILASLEVVAVRGNATLRKPDWLRDDQASIKEVGGTYYYRELIASRPTVMFLRVSQSRPTGVDPATGAFVLVNERSWGSYPYRLSHLPQAVPLDPGATHYCVVRLVEPNGAWWEFLDGAAGTGEFVCKRRLLTVTWSKVNFNYVDEDEAETNIRFTVWEGDSFKAAEMQRAWINVTTGDVVAVQPPNAWAIGPKAVNDANRRVYIDTQGTEFDGGPLDPSEVTGPLNQLELTVPVGRGLETVSGLPFSLSAADPEGDFRYTVEGSYSIDYVP